jgi:Transposase and inactivated derivatives
MSDDFDIRLERKLESNADVRGGDVTDVRRIELITGASRRRRWSSEDKARIVVESLEPGVSVSEVARRHGLSPQQLFGWRRKARASFHEAGNPAPADRPAVNPAPRPRRRKGSQSPSPEVSNDAPAFAPVVIAESARPSPRISSRPPAVGSIEIAIADAVVRVIGQAETEAIVAVLRALRRVS